MGMYPVTVTFSNALPAAVWSALEAMGATGVCDGTEPACCDFTAVGERPTVAADTANAASSRPAEFLSISPSIFDTPTLIGAKLADFKPMPSLFALTIESSGEAQTLAHLWR